MHVASVTPMATRVRLSLHGKHPWSFGMVISIVIVLIIFSFNIETVCSSAEEEEWYPPPICNRTANYTKDSQFVRNVNAALSTLRLDSIENTSQSMFKILEYGQSSNQIYALLQCRGDATVDQCYNCSQQAKIAVLQDCANYVGSRVWSKLCFLRYNGNYNFTGQLDSNAKNEINQHFFYNIDTIDYKPYDFWTAARQFLSSLASNISSGSSRNRYASGSTVDLSYRRIYALAQCGGDISLDDCNTCLSTTIDILFQHYDTGSGARGLTGNCIVQYDSKSFFGDPPLPPSQRLQKSSSSKIPIILGVLGGLVILMLMVGLFTTRRRLKSSIFERHAELGRYINEDLEVGEDQQPIPSLSNIFIVFEMEQLVSATENFHGKNKLGEGGFGAVYKGTTRDGTEIAVKRLSLKSMQGKREFLNEVKLVAKIQHRNLVKLLGCCAEGSERLIVYEYLPNNSLDKILFDTNKRRRLDWQERYNIIIGITRGLLYLHEDSHLRIIHRDIKPSNILLDEKLNAKIADFGLARLFLEDETHVSTKVAGTRGYMAPEYAMQGQLSAKADVYSFGILVLELMTGRKSIDLLPEMDILLEWAWRLYKRGTIMDMIDPEIVETCSDQEQALRCIHIGLLCTQAEATLRPSMSTINLMLSTKFMILPDPTKPAFLSSGFTDHTESTGNSGDSHPSATISSTVSSHTALVPPSNANASITDLVPR